MTMGTSYTVISQYSYLDDQAFRYIRESKFLPPSTRACSNF